MSFSSIDLFKFFKKIFIFNEINLSHIIKKKDKVLNNEIANDNYGIEFIRIYLINKVHRIEIVISRLF